MLQWLCVNGMTGCEVDNHTLGLMTRVDRITLFIRSPSCMFTDSVFFNVYDLYFPCVLELRIKLESKSWSRTVLSESKG